MNVNGFHFVFSNALDENENWTSIYDVPTGKNSGCFCPVCKEPVGAKNKGKNRDTILSPKQKAAHFYHLPDSNCPYRGESLVHILAKEVFAETLKMNVPSSHPMFESIVGKSQVVTFDDVFVEEHIPMVDGWIRPDLIAIKNSKILLIEFVKTHYLEEEKEQIIVNRKLNCLEITIHDIEYNIINPDIPKLKKDLENFLMGLDWVNADWIYNNKLNCRENLIEEELKKINHQKKLEEINRQKELEKRLESLENIDDFNFDDDDFVL